MNVKSCVVVALAAALAGCAQTTHKETSPSAAAYTLTPADAKVVETGVRSSLKELASARLDRMKATRRADGVINVCGYVGTFPFMGVLTVSPKSSFAVTGVGSDEGKAALTVNFCRQAGIDIEPL
ncbi:hypothetical protein NN6n1_22070 [Shinella zoogloeoides]